MTAPIPQHTMTLRDGGLGLSGVGADDLFCLVGSSSTGTAGTFYSYQGTDVQTVFDDLGEGPLPHQVAKHLLRSGGKPVLVYKSTAGTAGSVSAVTQSGAGPLPTLTGTPNDYHNAIVEIVVGGAVGTATFVYSLDGGDTYSEEIATAATYLLPSGVTVNFTAGTYVADETYSWTDTAPTLTNANVGAAFDAIIASAYQPVAVHVLGQAATTGDMATVATTCATKVSSAWAAKKFFYAIIEAPATTASSIITEVSGDTYAGVVICSGFAEVVVDKNSQIQKRASARVLVPRVARNPVGVHCLRDEADSDIDPLEDVVELVPDGAAASTGYHDEDRTPGANAARLSTLRTIAGIAGIYPTNMNTFAAASSDFSQLPYLQIALKAMRVWYEWGVHQLGARIPKNPSTGYIDPRFAASLEQRGKAVLAAQMGRAVDAIQVLVNRTDDVSADPTLRAKVRLVCPGYILEFESEIGLASALAA